MFSKLPLRVPGDCEALRGACDVLRGACDVLRGACDVLRGVAACEGLGRDELRPRDDCATVGASEGLPPLGTCTGDVATLLPGVPNSDCKGLLC